MEFNDFQLATPQQMEQLARAYKMKCESNAVKQKDIFALSSNFKNYDKCCSEFEYAKYLINFISTKTTSRTYKTKLVKTNEMLIKNKMIFELFFKKTELSFKPSFFGDYESAKKELMITLIDLTENILPLKEEKQFDNMTLELLETAKMLIASN